MKGGEKRGLGGFVEFGDAGEDVGLVAFGDAAVEDHFIEDVVGFF